MQSAAHSSKEICQPIESMGKDMAMMETTEHLATSRASAEADAKAQICELLAEVAVLRCQLHDQARVIADLQAEHQEACCPWHAQPWHRDHTH